MMNISTGPFWDTSFSYQGRELAAFLSSLFFDSQGDVDFRFGPRGIYKGVLFFDIFEESQLIQPRHREVPKRGIENSAFLKEDFAPEDLIGSCRVACEDYAVDSELTAFVDVYNQIHNLLPFVKIH